VKMRVARLLCSRSASDSTTKRSPILLYGTDVCPMNSADRHALQFTINRILYNILSDKSKD